MSKERKLILEASRSTWAVQINHGTEQDKSKKMKEMRGKILKRDNCTCQFCGFRSVKFQEIHHINNNHNDYRESNLETICPLCHQAFHLSSASITIGGDIIWLPEISQEQLNQLCIAIFIAEQSDDKKWKGPANTLMASLLSRTEFVNHSIANNASDPAVFADALLRLPKEFIEQKRDLISSFKLLPQANRFSHQIKYWSENGVYKKLTLDKWLDIIPNDVAEKIK